MDIQTLNRFQVEMRKHGLSFESAEELAIAFLSLLEKAQGVHQTSEELSRLLPLMLKEKKQLERELRTYSAITDMWRKMAVRLSIDSALKDQLLGQLREGTPN